MTGAKPPESTLALRGLHVAVAAVVLQCGTSVLACGTGSVGAVMASSAVAGKFLLARDACVAAPAGDPAPTSLPASAHAQQLGLYDPPAARPTGAPVPAPVSAVAATGTSAAAPLRTPSPAAPATAAPARAVGRDAVARALALVPQVSAVAEAYGIDPLLLHAIAHVESRHNPQAVSHAGAMGLMQVMPATARRFGVGAPATALRDPRVSLEVSSAYLKTLQRRFDNNLTLVIAAYNAGEGAVEKYGRRVPPYKETQGYVRDVLAHYRLLVGTREAIRPATGPAL